ncbi:hypothetical protein DL95DRAFT_451527 [Leptodontidium sp. 2 PMI_412]|nr:hypothetical protein DL95DRAFT_451527 [Leptodontidium sp. 2 PMI_412]
MSDAYLPHADRTNQPFALEKGNGRSKSDCRPRNKPPSSNHSTPAFDKTRTVFDARFKRCRKASGIRERAESKQLPGGYAQALENNQHALVATIRKLYALLREKQAWELDEPESDDTGKSIIHDIAFKLGCIRSGRDPEVQFGAAYETCAKDDNGSDEDVLLPGPSIFQLTGRANSSQGEYLEPSAQGSQAPSSEQQQTAGQPLSPFSHLVLEPNVLSGVQELPTGDLDLCATETAFPSIFGESQTNSSAAFNSSPFPLWHTDDDILVEPHMLELTAKQMYQCQLDSIPEPLPFGQDMLLGGQPLKMPQSTSFLTVENVILAPSILDYNGICYSADPMDAVLSLVEDHESGVEGS